MKKSIALIVALMLILTACTPAEKEQIKQTEPTNKLTTDTCFSFVFNGSQPYPGSHDIDISGLELNCLYAYNKTSDTVYQIGETVYHYRRSEQVVEYIYTHTHEYIYYVLENEPTKVYRSDYSGKEQEVVYESDGAEVVFVNFIDYYNDEDTQEKFILIEDFKRVIMCDPEKDSREVLMEQYYVWHANYDLDSLSYGGEDKGPTLYWHGKVSEDDTHELGYVCHILTGENWKATWH